MAVEFAPEYLVDGPTPPDPPSGCDCSWMPYSDYNGFRVAVQHLIEGDDTAQGTFSTDTVDLLIRLGEQRTYRDLRASTMIERLSSVVTDNAAPLPDCMLELKEVYFTGKRPLEIVPLDRLRSLEACSGATGPDARYVAQDAETLRFWPPASGTALGSYYGKPCPLKTGTWSEQKTFARYPEIFIFAALAESAPFIGEDARLPMWEAKYRDALINAMQDERVRVLAGGPLRIRAR